jgi:hypothetical protein
VGYAAGFFRGRWLGAFGATAMALAYLSGDVPGLAAGSRTPAGPLAADKTAYVSFNASPFPYRGIIPRKDIPFLDAIMEDQRGHTSPRGGVVYYEKPTYSDRRSLIYFPRGFDLRKPAVLVVFFHGNNVVLSRDVVGRQQVPRQLAGSGLNAALLAPQFAVDAIDSSAGTFWNAGAFSRYLDEAAGRLATVFGDTSAQATFARLPVVIVAYSGGYDPAAYAARVGGVGRRIAGIVLLDAPYAEEDKFADFIAQYKSTTFLFSAYTAAAAPNNALLMKLLAARRVPYTTATPARLTPGTVAFLATDPDLKHDDFVTTAWVEDPVAWVLSRIPGYPR